MSVLTALASIFTTRVVEVDKLFAVDATTGHQRITGRMLLTINEVNCGPEGGGRERERDQGTRPSYNALIQPNMLCIKATSLHKAQYTFM